MHHASRPPFRVQAGVGAEDQHDGLRGVWISDETVDVSGFDGSHDAAYNYVPATKNEASRVKYPAISLAARFSASRKPRSPQIVALDLECCRTRVEGLGL